MYTQEDDCSVGVSARPWFLAYGGTALWTKKHSPHTPGARRVELLGRSPLNQKLESKLNPPTPRRPKIRTQTDPVRYSDGCLAVPFGTFFRIDSGMFFSGVFRNVDDLWLRFGFRFGSVFFQFRIPFSDPVFAYLFSLICIDF